MAFTLTSGDFADGDYLDERHALSEAYGFGCAGGNASPQLSWRDPPEGTGSFALTCYDPDAPTGSGFWHWLVANIPPDVSCLAAGAGEASRSLRRALPGEMGRAVAAGAAEAVFRREDVIRAQTGAFFEAGAGEGERHGAASLRR